MVVTASALWLAACREPAASPDLQVPVGAQAPRSTAVTGAQAAADEQAETPLPILPTTVAPAAPQPTAPLVETNPFTDGTPEVQDCLRESLGEELFAALSLRQPNQEESDLMEPCMARYGQKDDLGERQAEAEIPNGTGLEMGNPLTAAIFYADDAELTNCIVKSLGEERYQELRSRAPTEEDMHVAGPCISGDHQAGTPDQAQAESGPSGDITDPASNPLAAIMERDDDSLKLCIQQSLGADIYEQLRSRPPSQVEMDIAGPCLSGNRKALECPATEGVTSTAWVEENTLFSRHYYGMETPFEDRQGPFESTGSADPRVVLLPDGRYRMYFGGGPDLNDVNYISTAISTDGVHFSLSDERILEHTREELRAGVGGPHASFAPLDTGGWRAYSSTKSPDDRHVLSYMTEDGLQLVQDPGRRLTLNEVGGGDLMSPYVIRDPAGGYRMFLTKAPDGETVGQIGGNSTTWIVSATSDDGLNWSMTDQVIDEAMRPSVLVNEDGTMEVWFIGGLGEGLLRMRNVMSDGDLSKGEIEIMHIQGGEADVHRISGGEYRVLWSRRHNLDEGVTEWRTRCDGKPIGSVSLRSANISTNY